MTLFDVCAFVTVLLLRWSLIVRWLIVGRLRWKLVFGRWSLVVIAFVVSCCCICRWMVDIVIVFVVTVIAAAGRSCVVLPESHCGGCRT